MAPIFLPPEMSDQLEWEDLKDLGLGNATDRMRRLYFQKQQGPALAAEGNLDRELVSLVLDHAKRVVAHPSRPRVTRTEPYLAEPLGDLAIEESLEESPFLTQPEDLLVQISYEKAFSCVAMLDASSSMSGDKHLLASIAVAVLLLEVPAESNGLIVFASEAKAIKPMATEETAEATVLKFLRSQPRGFTNIALGLEMGLRELNRSRHQKRKLGLIATDGRSTEGKDPMDVARLFDFLVVLHLHGPGSHLEASRAIAQAGQGVCLDVERFEDLPRKMYEAVRLLGRL